MPGQTVTIELPEELYVRLQPRAVEAERSLAAEVVQLLTMAIPAVGDGVPLAILTELVRLESLDDESLWIIARTTFSKQITKRMQVLQDKRQRQGLSDDERRLEAELAREYDRHMLVRAKVLLLLRQHGHDLRDLVGAN